MSPLRSDLLSMTSPFNLKTGKLQFSSESVALPFLKGTHLHMHRNE